MAAWDQRAEALHGVSHDMLTKKGEPLEKVANALNHALSGLLVYSDAPDWDGFWPYRLFQAANMRQTFVLTDFREAFSGVTPDAMTAFIAEASRIAPHTHRVGNDVLHMRTLYELAVRGR